MSRPSVPPGWSRAHRSLVALALLLGAAVTIAAANHERIIAGILHPSTPFDPETVPNAPDYTDPVAWSALPERSDAADASVPELPSANQMLAGVDVFYVHPTSYVGPSWNGPIDDPRLSHDTDELSTRIQSSVFNACCAIYAPRYRQANGGAFISPSRSGDSAIELAYSDVAAAFTHFLDRVGSERPFILASHSQGTVLADRLLQTRIAGTPLRDRLVAAYLIGGPIGVGAVPACERANQVGCVVAWNARGPSYVPNVFAFASPVERLCVNPLTWRRDGAYAAQG
jgi:hypothetical protein